MADHGERYLRDDQALIGLGKVWLVMLRLKGEGQQILGRKRSI